MIETEYVLILLFVFLFALWVWEATLYEQNYRPIVPEPNNMLEQLEVEEE